MNDKLCPRYKFLIKTFVPKILKITIGIIAVIIIGGIWYGANRKLNEGGPIKIGAVLSLTGNAAEYGQSTQRGMDLAIEEINKSKGRAEIVYEDEKSTPEGAVSAFQKLISIDKLPVVIGFVGSSGVLASAPIANNSKVVMLSTLASSDDIKNAGDYVFRIRENASSHGIEMARFTKNTLALNKVALFYANAANGISYADSLKKEFEKLGGQIVFDDKYTEKSGDFRAGLTKIKIANPDAIYIAGLAPDMAEILKQGKEMGIKAMWLASAGAENPKLIQAAGSSANGLIFTTPAFNPNQDNDKIRKFVADYKTKYNEIPDFAAANGYDGLMVVYDVIKKFGYSSGEIKNGLYSVKNYQGVGGDFSFDEFGEVQKSIMFKTVKNGQFVPYEK